MGDVANVVSGPAKLFIAAAGTGIPTLTGNESDFANFTNPGFTDKGIEIDYTSTDKDIEVDELTTAVDVLITHEKMIINVAMAETTLQNLYYCISGGTLVSATEITIGGKVRPSEFILGVMGPSPSTNKIRQILIYRVMPKGNPKIHYQRKDKVMYACQWQGLGDSSRADGANLCDIQDF